MTLVPSITTRMSTVNTISATIQLKSKFPIQLTDTNVNHREDLQPRNSRMSIVTFDMNWRSYDDRSQMVFDTLFPGVMEQDEFRMNVSIQN